MSFELNVYKLPDNVVFWGIKFVWDYALKHIFVLWPQHEAQPVLKLVYYLIFTSCQFQATILCFNQGNELRNTPELRLRLQLRL